MKNLLLLFLIIAFISCSKNTSPIATLKYSENDLLPLDDSTKSIYYKDAAYIEFRQLIQDSSKRYIQVTLNENHINSHYEDLLNIYNNSYSISNSFFEKVTYIHTYAANHIYYLFVSVDTSKTWVEEWLTGNNYTGVVGIDSLVENYDIEVTFYYKSTKGYEFKLNTFSPINYFALKNKIEKINEFIFVEPDGIIGGGSSISLIDTNDNIYKYSIGWGDCPSGCIYYHYWEIKVVNEKAELYKEYGDPLF